MAAQADDESTKTTPQVGSDIHCVASTLLDRLFLGILNKLVSFLGVCHLLTPGVTFPTAHEGKKTYKNERRQSVLLLVVTYYPPTPAFMPARIAKFTALNAMSAARANFA